MNRLFVANKPPNISCNKFLSQLKKKYGVKKAGFSGTLDPFASGCLVVAFGSYTKFFRFFNKSPKTYIATMWIGAKSDSFDNENITEVNNLLAFHSDGIEIIRSSLLGRISYTPPKYSAKKINGKRAYELARRGDEFELSQSQMDIFDCNIISYMHPFLTLKISVSEGAYIRSYAQLFAQKLGVGATLSSLTRVSEGRFKFEGEKELNPLEFLNLIPNEYGGEYDDILLGKKLDAKNFSCCDDGKYLINFGNLLSVLEFKDSKVEYLLNRIEI